MGLFLFLPLLSFSFFSNLFKLGSVRSHKFRNAENFKFQHGTHDKTRTRQFTMINVAAKDTNKSISTHVLQQFVF